MRFRDPRRVPRLTTASISDAEYLELTIGGVAHGGHCVARIPAGPDAGRVVFVRHALPGEKVLARITDKGKVWRADAVEVLDNPSPYRVASFWPEAGPGGVGGGELAHVSPAGQRLWKAAVLNEQLRRLAGVNVASLAPRLAVSAYLTPLDHGEKTHTVAVELGGTAKGAQETEVLPPGDTAALGVEPAKDWPDGAGYRTRIDLLVDETGEAGMRQARSHQIEPLTEMPLATEQLQQFAEQVGVWSTGWVPGSRVTIIAPAHPIDSESDTAPLLLVDGEPLPRPDGSTGLLEQVSVGGKQYQYRLAPNGFWQVHAQAPETLVAAVLQAAGELVGKKVLELYAGAGLFTSPLAAAIGARGKLLTIEGSKSAVEYARANIDGLRAQLGAANLPEIEQWAGSVARLLPRVSNPQPNRHRAPRGSAANTRTAGTHSLVRDTGPSEQPLFDLCVVDPPREGLEKEVLQQLIDLAPTRFVYVSCDPAALARDTGRLIQGGYHLSELRAFDLFPMTHHVESVATFDLIAPGSYA